MAKASDSTNGSEPMRPSSGATYVVQVLEDVTLVSEWQVGDGNDPSGGRQVPVTADASMWRDVATVTVPARSHRATIIGEALRQARVMPTADGALRLRVLDARAAAVTEVGLKVRDPELSFK